MADNNRNIDIGSEIFFLHNMDNINSIKRGIVTKLKEANYGDLVFIDNHHKPEDCIYLSYCYPINVLEEMTLIIQKRAALKKAYDDSMKLIYQLNNAIARGERD